MSNIVLYHPKYGNFSATYAVMPGEGDNGSLSDATSYSVASKDDLYVAVASDSDVKALIYFELFLNIRLMLGN